jgi:hypothetical protein
VNKRERKKESKWERDWKKEREWERKRVSERDWKRVREREKERQRVRERERERKKESERNKAIEWVREREKSLVNERGREGAHLEAMLSHVSGDSDKWWPSGSESTRDTWLEKKWRGRSGKMPWLSWDRLGETSGRAQQIFFAT